MKVWRRVFRLAEFGFELFFLFLQGDHLLVDLRRRSALQDKLDEHLQLSVYLPNFSPGSLHRHARLGPEPIGLPCELLTECLEKRGVHKLASDGFENPAFEFVAAYVQFVVAGAFVAGRGASEHRRRNHRIPAATASTFCKTRQNVAGTAPVPEMRFFDSVLLFRSSLPALRGVPKVITHDAKSRGRRA